MTGYLQGDAVPTTASHRRTKPVTIPVLQTMCEKGEKITMLTCYDASFTALLDRCGIDTILIGDSLGMVCQGHSSTLPVSVSDIAYHTASVFRAKPTALILSDLPFGSYGTPEMAFISAVQLIQSGAQMVKLEGGAWLAPTVRFLTERAIPVCAHLGLTPQSVHQMGGYKVQGKTSAAVEQLKSDALALQAAGASMLVLEAIPASLGKEITELLAIPTIGIGAGPDCAGQVLVLHDLLGVFPGHKARFVKDFMEGQTNIDSAIKAYIAAVKDKSFPAPEHCF